MDGFYDGSVSGQSVDLRLRELGRTIPPSEIAELWVFPPLAALEGSAEFFLFTCFDGDRRRLYSACLSPGVRANGTSGQIITEHGLVPAGSGAPYGTPPAAPARRSGRAETRGHRR